MANEILIPAERIEKAILLIRGQKVMLDRDLADLYGVPTGVLNQAVKRNSKRFPRDFMFRLSKAEMEKWKSQTVISNPGAKMGLRKHPYAFTEQGVAMLSSVLRSSRAIEVNIAIMRAFVRLRQILGTHEDLVRKLEQLERTLGEHLETWCSSGTFSPLPSKPRSTSSCRRFVRSIRRSTRFFCMQLRFFLSISTHPTPPTFATCSACCTATSGTSKSGCVSCGGAFVPHQGPGILVRTSR
jgi:ORF6N domain